MMTLTNIKEKAFERYWVESPFRLWKFDTDFLPLHRTQFRWEWCRMMIYIIGLMYLSMHYTERFDYHEVLWMLFFTRLGEGLQGIIIGYKGLFWFIVILGGYIWILW